MQVKVGDKGVLEVAFHVMDIDTVGMVDLDGIALAVFPPDAFMPLDIEGNVADTHADRVAGGAVKLEEGIRDIGLLAVAAMSMIENNLGLLAALALDDHMTAAFNRAVDGERAFTESENHSVVIGRPFAHRAQLHGEISPDAIGIDVDVTGLSHKCRQAHENNKTTVFQ